MLLSAAIAFVVAAVSVGAVAADQATKARPAVYDIEAAVEFVAAGLPPEVTAIVSFEEVRQVLMWHIEYLELKGVATYRADDDASAALVVVTDEEPIAYILGRADEADVEILDEHIVAILSQQEAYYHAIGAFGAPVVGPEDPTTTVD